MEDRITEPFSENQVIELFSEEQITERICELGREISRDYKGKEIKFICVLRGASIFYAELAKRITLPMRFDFISVSSYGNQTESQGKIRIRKELDESVLGEHVILVEDIIDTGRTLKLLRERLLGQGASSVTLAALLDKPERRKVEIQGDYIGFTVPDEFVVGYGLDYQQYYRNLPYIGKIILNQG